MNTIVRKHLSISPYADAPKARYSADTRQLLSLGRNRNWNFQVLGRAPMPEGPIRIGEWLLAPARGDPTAIPVRTLARVQAILVAGIALQGFVLVHEAPMQLKAPADNADAGAQVTGSGQRRPLVKWVAAAGGALVLATAAAAGAVILAAAVMALASILLLPALVVAAVTLDPILVAVTDDDHWIEIDRWQTE